MVLFCLSTHVPFFGLPRYVPYADCYRAYRGSSGIARSCLAVQEFDELSQIETGLRAK